MQKRKIAIIGGGPAGLMAADTLSPFFDVCVYDKNNSVGHKFLLAGKGGFNLTNSMKGEELIKKYTPEYFLKEALQHFDSVALREWLLQLGVQTFEGSSGRIFPEKGLTPADVLKKIIHKLALQGVEFRFKHEFVGFDANQRPRMKHESVDIEILADYCIFALGGASWPVTGSTGGWLPLFETINIKTLPFQSSNCGINIGWTENLIANHSGKPLKNIAISINNIQEKGEALITDYGLEGNAIYPLIPEIRKELNENGCCQIILDLKPFNTDDQLVQKIAGKTSAKTKNYAEIFNLNSTHLALLKSFTTKETFLSPELFARSLKHLTIHIQSLRPVEEAISTVGGIDLDELNSDFSLKKHPTWFAIGEMLDWDAPTGGFLLQGSFSMGHWVGSKIIEREQNKR